VDDVVDLVDPRLTGEVAAVSVPLAKGPESVCGHEGCAAVPVVHWSRRLSEAEVAAYPPEQRTDDMRALVYACADHAIGIDEAALIHAADCTAPRAEHLPGCDCAPVPEPQPAARPTATLPTGWQITT
jgi:hypothetical protein